MISERELFKLDKDNPSLAASGSSSKTLYKYWSGLTKLFLHYISQGQSITYEPLGTFLPSPKSFVPSHQFLQDFCYSSPDLEKKSSITITYSLLSSLCNISTSVLKACGNDFISKCLQQISLGVTVRLNLKIGFLVLKKQRYDYFPKEDGQRYNASNPNRVNSDNSTNEFDYTKKKILYMPVKLPPLTVHGKNNITIIERLCRKQVIDSTPEPYDHSFERYSKSIERLREYTPEPTSIKVLVDNEDIRKNIQHEDLLEMNRANKSMIESKILQKKDEVLEKSNYKPQFFPFTYGDAIEENTKKLNLEKYNFYKALGEEGRHSPESFYMKRLEHRTSKAIIGSKSRGLISKNKYFNPDVIKQKVKSCRNAYVPKGISKCYSQSPDKT